MSKAVLFKNGGWTTAHLDMSGQRASVRLRIQGADSDDTIAVDMAAVRLGVGKSAVQAQIPMHEETDRQGRVQYTGEGEIGGFEVVVYASPYKGEKGWFFRISGAANQAFHCDF